MTQEELINAFKYIVKKCDMLINNGNYEADDYTRDTVEDIAELCNHILDGDYGKLAEVKEVDIDKEIENAVNEYYNECEKKLREMNDNDTDMSFLQLDKLAKHFFKLGLSSRLR